MKNDELNQAREMYFQGNMTKTEIATTLGVNRRTILLWSKQEDWDKLRHSARVMPSIIAEKIYYILDNYVSQVLRTPDCTFADHKDAQTIYLFTSAIKKLKNRSTMNENIEMFNFFLEKLEKTKPELAEQIRPEMEEYIYQRTNDNISDHYMDGVNQFGGMGFPPDKENAEEWQDKADMAALEEELKRNGGNYEQALKTWQQQPPADPRSYTPPSFG